jgi:phospholipid/cholesterol/gamma-HCH transport system substrate-binding protein
MSRRRSSVATRALSVASSPRGLAVVLAFLMAAALLVFLSGTRTTEASAYFAHTNGIYAGDEVRVLGVPVGKVTKITADRDRVRVDFKFAHGVRVPADAKAVIVAPSLVSSRYLQLAPRYDGGPTLHDGAVIPQSRTAVPIEWDQIKDQLDDLAVALGPNGANKKGALSALVTSSSQALGGEGETINQTIANLSAAVETLQNGSGDAFSTVQNLQVFTSALAESDQQIALFTARLDSVSGLLADNKKSLRASIANLAVAVGKVERFVKANRAALKTSITGLTDVTSVVAKQQEALAQTLQTAPNALSNLIESVHQRQNAVGVDVQGANIHSPGQLICGAIGGASESSAPAAGNLCQGILGNLFDQAANDSKTTWVTELLGNLLGIGS